MSRRRDQRATWGPAALPDIRRATVETVLRPPTEAERLRARVAFGRDLPDDVTPEDAAYAAALTSADLWWTTREMTHVALDASTDMPPWTPVELCPGPQGIMIWDAPLPPLPGSVTETYRESADRIAAPVRRDFVGVLWSVYGGSLHVHPLALIGAQPMPALIETGASWSARMGVPYESGATPEETAVMYLLASTWSLMMIPTVASVIPDFPDGRDARLRGRDNIPPARVTTIDLRPMRFVSVVERDGEEPTRVYRHRWMVRGHWRNQAHGPGRTERRPTWVPSYIKGPEGAPLLAREHVYTWRR